MKNYRELAEGILSSGGLPKVLADMNIKTRKYSDPSIDGISKSFIVIDNSLKYELIFGLNDDNYPVVLIRDKNLSVELVLPGGRLQAELINAITQYQYLQGVIKRLSRTSIKLDGAKFDLKFSQIIKNN